MVDHLKSGAGTTTDAYLEVVRWKWQGADQFRKILFHIRNTGLANSLDYKVQGAQYESFADAIDLESNVTGATEFAVAADSEGHQTLTDPHEWVRVVIKATAAGLQTTCTVRISGQ